MCCFEGREGALKNKKGNVSLNQERMKKIIMLFLMVTLVSCMPAFSQKTCVIASAEDHVPIREALIHTDNNHWARSDYRGYWTMKYQFDSATVSKSGYLKTSIKLKELPDTIFLIPDSKQLGTVEVWGKNQQHIREMEQQVKEAAKDVPQQTGVSFDLANMLDIRGRRDRKHLKSAHELLGEYDKKDPIVSAYEQATGKKYQLEQPGNGSAKYKLKHPEIESSNSGPTRSRTEVENKKTHVFVESSVGITQ